MTSSRTNDGGPAVIDCVALIVAAGRGERAGGGLPKQYRAVAGVAVLRRSIVAFAGHPGVGAVRCVIHAGDRALYEAAVEGLDLLEPTPGGATRQESVRLGLESLALLAPRLVLIHDAARPFVSPAVIDATLAALGETEGAIPGLAVHDTLKRAKAGRIEATVERAGLWRAQTPQGFRYGAILAAHRRVAGREHSDDAAVAEAAGMAVRIVAGSEDNVKLTTSEDFSRAERALTIGTDRIAVGSGFDVHAFGPGTSVRLCGVTILHDQGLAGHSDADVGLHALTDAILGALGEGDIGSHFPPSEARWKGADSALFLRHAADLVRDRGGRIEHVDVTLICERPKVGPHRGAMRQRVARILDLAIAAVGIKATTTEGLGFTGRREGIAAQAVATLRLPLLAG
ncbi:MAG: bifunctional 2-C-methyl-D-erythritol 4-phosphate cytidylyltransferase/2-C-methyl-D-erythritol 2,4-cyclodiphosphate synthase [Alphaproteobacteria bacterium]|nr:bifunctional 2-C-methyl-D-erythritol 4-phosphate cytidylyltransferase/2-C-methyl-D-erythritol 2,4-cyclodiphosphate synthase [Alphaproteobacteria bacterium]